MKEHCTLHHAWPFLIGSSLSDDYCLIAAPAFVYKSNLANLLINISADKSLNKNYYSEAISACQTLMTIVFRRRNGMNSDIGMEEQGYLEDNSGRKIVLTEGIIFGEYLSFNQLCLREEQFYKSLEIIHDSDYFREFWYHGSRFKDVSYFNIEISSDLVNEEDLICWEVLS